MSVAGPGVAGSRSSPTALDASWVVASGNLEILAPETLESLGPLHIAASNHPTMPSAGTGLLAGASIESLPAAASSSRHSTAPESIGAPLP